MSILVLSARRTGLDLFFMKGFRNQYCFMYVTYLRTVLVILSNNLKVGISNIRLTTLLACSLHALVMETKD
jgi:hypothetical protein